MTVIDNYLQTIEEPKHSALQHVRQVILAAAPDAVEVITYGMPGFKYNGKYLISFASFKSHLSVFPGAETIEALLPELSGYTTSKGTIQFSVEKPLSDDLITAIVKQRIYEIQNA